MTTQKYIAPDEIRNPGSGYATYYLQDGDRYRDDQDGSVSVSGMLEHGFKRDDDQYVYYTKPTDSETHLVSVLDGDGDRWEYNRDHGAWVSPTNFGQPLLNPQSEISLLDIEDDYKVEEYVYSQPVLADDQPSDAVRRAYDRLKETLSSDDEGYPELTPEPGDTVRVTFEGVYRCLATLSGHHIDVPEGRGAYGMTELVTAPELADITVLRRAEPETYRGVAYPENWNAMPEHDRELWEDGVDAVMDREG